MKNNIERETIKEKAIKNSKSRIIHSNKNKKNLNKIIKSKEVQRQRFPKKEERTKIININNKSLTDWNKIKIGKKIINNLPIAPQFLYLKKKISQVSKANNNCLINIIKKKNLSSTQEKIEKFEKKIVYDSKNLSKKKNISEDLFKCPDIDLEMEKDFGNEDDEMKVHIPNMTRKKKSNYYN